MGSAVDRLPGIADSIFVNLQLSLDFSGLALLKLSQNLLLKRLGLRRRGPTPNNLAITANQELLEVPLDTLETHDTRLLRLHPLEQRSSLVAVDIKFAENRERDTVVDLAERLDLIVGAGILTTELIAGEADDGEVVGVRGLDLLVELFEALELRGETALGSGVDGEDDFALQGGEVELIALLYRETKVPC